MIGSLGGYKKEKLKEGVFVGLASLRNDLGPNLGEIWELPKQLPGIRV